MTAFADRSVRALVGRAAAACRGGARARRRAQAAAARRAFSALDRKLRETMQIELRRLLRELGTTAILVTHDQDEALMMSDRIAVMNRGGIEQLAEPADDLPLPRHAVRVGFVGLSTGRRQGRRTADDGEITVDTGRPAVRAASSSPAAPSWSACGPNDSVDQPGDNAVRAELRHRLPGFEGAAPFRQRRPTSSGRAARSAGRLPRARDGNAAHLAGADTLVYPAS